MSLMLASPNGSKLAKFLDDGWPFPQLFAGMGDMQIRVEEKIEGNTLLVRAEAPGIDPDKDIDLSINNNRLMIAVERRESNEVKDESVFRSEFRYGSFNRVLSIPDGTKVSDIKATYRDGILEVRVPIPAAEESITKVPVHRD
jgi:HSP20 family protein